MMDLREKIARAIHGQCDRELDASWGDWLPEADAVIEVLKQQEPVAWREFDAAGGYDYRSFADNEAFRDEYIKRNGDEYATWVEPLYAAPGAQAAVPEAQDTDDLVSKALRQAYQLGQMYWHYIDSERTSDWKRADTTREKFDTLVDETRAALLGLE